MLVHTTVLPRLIGCLKLQVMFRLKLQVMFRLKAPLGQKEQLIIGLFCPKGYEDKAPYASTPACTLSTFNTQNDHGSLHLLRSISSQYGCRLAIECNPPRVAA